MRTNSKNISLYLILATLGYILISRGFTMNSDIFVGVLVNVIVLIIAVIISL